MAEPLPLRGTKTENGRVRLGLVGSARPYRGGIATYGTMLHRTLQARYDLRTVSFRKQYPRWLYPGPTDIEPGFEGWQEPGVEYLLHPFNTLSWKRAYRVLVEHQPHTVFFVWWTVFWALPYAVIAAQLERRGIRTVFICLNVLDHDARFWISTVVRAVLSRRRTFLVHSNAEADRLRAMVPGSRVAVFPHPLYTQYPPPGNKLPRRAKLELLFFGFVRPYKGLDVLAKAMKLLQNEDVFLTVAGEWWIHDAALRRELESGGRVEIIDRYITEQETADCFARADVVVLPYRHATATGVIPVAYHHGKPVIATRVGGLPDLVDDGQSGLLIPPDDPGALAAAIRAFLRGTSVTPEGVRKMAAKMTWEGFADSIASLL